MYLSVSNDGGKTFAKAEKLGVGSWPLDHCPMDGGSLAVLVDGKVATIWRREKSIYFLRSRDAGEFELGLGEQPWVTASDRGPIAVWLRKRGNALLLWQPGRNEPIELAKAARDPIIAAGGPRNEIVVAAWEEASGDGRRIVCQRINLTR
jgi:hypothetical protein